MRLIAFALAALAIVGPAAAQYWQEYSYPAYARGPNHDLTADGRSVRPPLPQARAHSL
jgi:hypothetical protein